MKGFQRLGRSTSFSFILKMGGYKNDSLIMETLRPEWWWVYNRLKYKLCHETQEMTIDIKRLLLWLQTFPIQ